MVFVIGISWGIFGIMLLFVGDIVVVLDISLMLLIFFVVLAGVVFGDYVLLIFSISILLVTGVGSYYIDYVVI